MNLPCFSGRAALPSRTRLVELACGVVLSALLGAPSAWGQAYPAHPIRLVVPFPAGGPSDIMGRLVGEKLGAALGQTVVVENKAGAGGAIGIDAVAKSAPDGYTLGMASSGPVTILPVLQKLPYDPLRDLTHIAMVGTIPPVLAVNAALPVKNVAELIAYARANPGKLSFASTGIGATPHMAVELLKSTADIDMVHVPYKGSAPALADLIAGQVQVMVDGVVTVMPHVQSGKLRVLAATSAQRIKLYPELPTLAESGLPGFNVVPFYQIVGPANLPPAVVARLNAALVKVMGQPEVIEKLQGMGAEAAATSSAAATRLVADELPRWAAVAKRANIRID